LIARWQCQSTLHFHISVKQGPEEKKIKGLNLSPLRLATTRYCSFVSTGHKGTYQTNCLKLTFNSTSPLVGCGEVRFGRVQTKVPSLPIIGTWVGPQAKTGARYERGGLIVERFAIHSVRASFEPRASLIVRASKQLRASQSLRAPVVLSGWVRVPFGAFLSFYGVIKTAIGRPNQKSAEKCNTCLLVGVQINKKT